MKSFLFLPGFAFLFLFGKTNAQSPVESLPPATLVVHHLLPITYNSTTVLLFPAAVKPVDRGNRDILAQKQSGTENVLKLKAARKEFSPTNLHVFTADGKCYAFDVIYTDSIGSTYNLAQLQDVETHSSNSGAVLLADELLNADQIERYVAATKRISPIRHTHVFHQGQMKFKLCRLAIGGPLLLFQFQITNRSNLKYSLDFLRMYTKDKQKAKRTSVQEREILPVYVDTAVQIEGEKTATCMFLVPAFTLGDGKQCIVEAYEKSGSRILSLHLSNKILFRAKMLQKQ